MPVVVVEGGPPQMVNIDVKQEGLRPDPTDRVQVEVHICMGKMPHLPYSF